MFKVILFILLVFGIATAVPKSRARMAEAAKPQIDKVKAKLVPRRLEAMADQLDVRLQRGDDFPQQFEAWLRRDFSGAEVDPWENFYYSEQQRGGYRVGSMGPDGKKGTPDDIVVDRQRARRR